jgi:predicted DCC family thiol-disulfide oxidoreductase YuxK
VSVAVVRFSLRGGGRRPPYALVYDCECQVCQRSVRAVRAWDREGIIEPLPFQAPGVMARFPWIPPRAFDEAVQFIGPRGETWQGADAVEKVLDVLPKGRLVSWVFKVPLVRGIARRAYRWVARNRHRIGCGDHCQSGPRRILFDE